MAIVQDIREKIDEFLNPGSVFYLDLTRVTDQIYSQNGGFGFERAAVYTILVKLMNVSRITVDVESAKAKAAELIQKIVSE